jgi:hypothetical protein
MRGVIPRERRAFRTAEESYALSACSLAGRFRGRPGFLRGPMIDGTASTSGRSWVESWVLAADRRTASGRHRSDPPSGGTWCRTCHGRWSWAPSVRPPFGPHAQCVDAGPAPVDDRLIAQPVEERFMQSFPEPGRWPITQPSPAGRTVATASSFATAAMGIPSATRRRCRRGRRNPGSVGDRPWASAVPPAIGVRWLPRDSQELAMPRS